MDSAVQRAMPRQVPTEGLSSAKPRRHLPRSALRALVTAAVGVGTVVAAATVGASVWESAIFAAGVLVLALVYSRLERAAVADAVDRARGGEARERDHELASGAVAERFLANEFAAARRGRRVTLVIFGLDDVADFSEAQGISIAGRAVRAFAGLLCSQTRRMDLSARYGTRHDTFLSILSEADAAVAERFVARIRAAVAEQARALPMPALSTGIVEMERGIDTPEEFLELAERALAEARAAGGNRDCVKRYAPAGV